MNMMQRIPVMSDSISNAVEISLNAAVVTIDHATPCFLAVRGDSVQHGLAGLPTGPFVPTEHASLELGLRDMVRNLTGVELGYVEQLYTFGDQSSLQVGGNAPGTPVITLGYLALTPALKGARAAARQWLGAYDYLPWEDWRDGRPESLSDLIEPKLTAWAGQTVADHEAPRQERVRIAFGLDGAPWDEERVLDRYEILQEAGLGPALAQLETLPDPRRGGHIGALELQPAHMRIVATALGRLRAKIKYRPVLFELMDSEFTLFELQRTVEAILGSRLHKQNFRRLVESGGLVDATSDIRTHTGGRPAKLFRFRREVLMERQAPGVRVRAGLAA
jgi:hypothetical protein